MLASGASVEVGDQRIREVAARSKDFHGRPYALAVLEDDLLGCEDTIDDLSDEVDSRAGTQP